MIRNNLSRVWVLLPEMILALMCIFVFNQGVSATRDLTWPGDLDLFRDISQAQTIADGNFLGDPQYLNETLWYNPLTPSIVAVASRILAQPIPSLYVRLGAYLNLLAPIAFFVLIALLFDRWTAVIATFAFLFIAPATNEPSWALGTYSPWLFSANFAQGIFYVAVALYLKARSTNKRRWYVLAGLSWGLTFLAHTAPAIILGLIITITTLWTMVRRLPAWPVVRSIGVNFAMMIGLALLVSAPLIYSIWGRYHLQVLNPAPSNWAYEPLTLRNIDVFFKANFIDRPVFLVVVMVGLISLVRVKVKRREAGSVLLWLSITIIALVYSYIRQLLKRNNIVWPNVVPAFHFLFYFRIAQSILFGCGLFAIVHAAVDLLNRFVLSKRSVSWQFIGGRIIEPAILIVVLTLMFVPIYPDYLNSDDLVGQRLDAQKAAEAIDTVAAYQWLRDFTQPGDVMLAKDTLGTYVVAPAGRKLVAADSYFTNPYVDWQARNADRDAMFTALRTNDSSSFTALADKYQATYVVAAGALVQSIDAAGAQLVHKEFSSGAISIYRIVRP